MNQDTTLGPQTPDELLKIIYALQNAEHRARNKMEKTLRVVGYHRDMAKRNGAVELATILDLIYDQVGPDRCYTLQVTPS